jgi:Kdo2-lipid IVA lauroyltransferase/acyltransferase
VTGALRDLPSQALVGLLWLLHWLPLPLLALLGHGLGLLLYVFLTPRRRVVAVNLRLCFPQWSEARRRQLARQHFRALGRSALERSLLWWAPAQRLKRLVRLEGAERVRALLAEGRPVILLAPHFVGLDMGGSRVAMEFDVVNIYAPQRNKVIDRWVLHGRTRFGDQLLLARHEGVRAVVKAMKGGRPFHYSPDVNQRRQTSVFAPFFGMPASTVTGLPRFAHMAGAVVVPCVTRMLPWGQGYRVELGEPWADYPTADVEADVRRMNAEIERVVLTMPEQYYWVHRRFKTRPPGVPRRYER